MRAYQRSLTEEKINLGKSLDVSELFRNHLNSKMEKQPKTFIVKPDQCWDHKQDMAVREGSTSSYDEKISLWHFLKVDIEINYCTKARLKPTPAFNPGPILSFLWASVRV